MARPPSGARPWTKPPCTACSPASATWGCRSSRCDASVPTVPTAVPRKKDQHDHHEPSETNVMTIELKDVTKRYGETVAVDHLSFTVKSGIVTGFLGPNGAGKTTTMRMILGLDAPSSGAVTVNGQSYRTIAAPMHEVGALLDAKAAFGGHTARQHLRWLAQAGGIPHRRIGEVLDLVGLAGGPGQRVGG